MWCKGEAGGGWGYVDVRRLKEPRATAPGVRRMLAAVRKSPFRVYEMVITYFVNHMRLRSAAHPYLPQHTRACVHTYHGHKRIYSQIIPPPDPPRTRVCPGLPLLFGACVGAASKVGRGGVAFSPPRVRSSFTRVPPPTYPPSTRISWPLTSDLPPSRHVLFPRSLAAVLRNPTQQRR